MDKSFETPDFSPSTDVDDKEQAILDVMEAKATELIPGVEEYPERASEAWARENGEAIQSAPPVKVYTSPLTGVYPDYESALAVCKTPHFAHGEAVARDNLYFKIHRKIRKAASDSPSALMKMRLDPYLRAAEQAGGKNLRILDVGGTDGRYYWWLSRILGEAAISRYDVLEAKQVAALGRQIKNTPVSFYGDPDEVPAEPYDIVIFGAMLQVLPDPASFFEKILERVQARFVVVTVFPLRDDLEQDVISAKRPGGTYGHPYWMFSRQWLSRLDRHGAVTRLPMPSYRFTLDRKRFPQWAFIIQSRP